ncbi:MAG: ABC transporter permease [Acidobacteria bacterium]|nr:ABC transporter permease [Acidobacteriota bacterium]
MRSLWVRFLGLFRRDAMERELDDELRSLVDLHADEYIRAGLTPDAARLEALRRVGGVNAVKEAYRQQARLPYLEPFAMDLRYAARRLRQRPAFLATSVLTLAIGIGVHATVFAMIQSLLLKPLPFREPARVFNIENTRGSNISFPNYKDVRDRNEVFSAVAAARAAPMAVNAGGETERYWGFLVTGNYFELLGIRAWRGRLIMPSDDLRDGAHPIMVISYKCWQRRFGGDASAIGREVRINGNVFTIIGVTPPGFTGNAVFYAADSWVPFSMIRVIENRDWRGARGTSNAWAIARLRDGVSKESAEASLAVLAQQMAVEHPGTNDGLTFLLEPVGWVSRQLRGGVRNAGLALLLVSALTLLVACSNISGLLFAQGSDRGKEIALRCSLGAGRGAVFRLLSAELLLIGAGAAAAGLLIVHWLTGVVAAAVPQLEVPFELPVAPDWQVFAYTGAVALLAALAAGMWPAWRAASADAFPVLKGDSGSAVLRRIGLRDFVVGVQIAVSVVLLAGAAMMVHSFQEALRSPLGVQPEGAVVARFDLGLHGYTPEKGREVQRQILERVRELPGVDVAGMSDSIPFSINDSSNGIRVEGQQEARGARTPTARVFVSTPGMFRAMGTRLLAGRDFDDRDRAGAKRVAIVNEEFAVRLIGDRNAVGRRIKSGCRDCDWIEIIGIVETGRYGLISEQPKPALWTAAAQGYNSNTSIMVRSGRNEDELLKEMRRIIAETDPGIAVFDAAPYRKYLDFPATPLRILTASLTGMGVIAAFLCGLGLYAVVAYGASKRTRELGIRAALGATSSDLALTLTVRMAAISAVSAAVGITIAVFAIRLLANLLQTTANPAIFVVAVLLILLVTFVACLVPSIRAMRIQPLEALRQE